MVSMLQRVLVLLTVVLSLNTAFALPEDNLRCGGSYHGKEIQFRFNPLGGPFNYSGTTADDYFLVYVKYSPEKNDRIEVTTAEFIVDEHYEALKEALRPIPDLEYLRKPLTQKLVSSLYRGIYDYRREQGGKIISFSCSRKETRILK